MESAKTELKSLKSDHTSLQSDHKSLQSDFKSLQSEHKSLQDDHKSLKSDHASAKTTIKQLTEKNDSLAAEVAELKEQLKRERELRETAEKRYTLLVGNIRLGSLVHMVSYLAGVQCSAVSGTNK